LIHELFSRRIFDAKLAQLRADAVNRALEEFAPLLASRFVHRKFNRRRSAV
jgi:hypothetical protein